VKVRRAENNGCVRNRRVSAQLPYEFVAIHCRHEDVGNNQIGMVTTRGIETLGAIAGLKRVMARFLKQRGQILPTGWAVVNDEDICHGLRPPQRCLQNRTTILRATSLTRMLPFFRGALRQFGAKIAVRWSLDRVVASQSDRQKPPLRHLEMIVASGQIGISSGHLEGENDRGALMISS